MPFPTPIPEKIDDASVKANQSNEDENVEDTQSKRQNDCQTSHLKEDENDIDADGETDPEESAEKAQPTTTSVISDAVVRRATSTPVLQENVDVEKGFDGLTFQEAQEKIVSELIQRKDKE